MSTSDNILKEQPASQRMTRQSIYKNITKPSRKPLDSNEKWQRELTFQDRDMLNSALSVLSSCSLKILHLASSTSTKGTTKRTSGMMTMVGEVTNMRSVKEDMFSYINEIYSNAYHRYERQLILDHDDRKQEDDDEYGSMSSRQGRRGSIRTPTTTTGIPGSSSDIFGIDDDDEEDLLQDMEME